MPPPDLNLLIALDALLTESSVAGAARRLGLSASAMSRTLARLRAVTGDPLLAPAGRKMVPTPRAEALRAEVSELSEAVQAVLRPEPSPDIRSLERTFVIRANDGFVDVFAARLVAAVAAEAPGIRLRFAPKPDKDPRPLREGRIDLDIGVLGETAPEFKTKAMFRDVFIGVARANHPLLTDGPITPERFIAFGHVVASRSGRPHGPVDDALAVLGLSRTIAAVVPSFPAVFSVVSASDLLGLAPRSYFALDHSSETARRGPIVSFALPVRVDGITVSQIWHPRHDADPAHRWLRGLIFDACRRSDSS
ncbi:MAG TPA: LysR family transcriptional regulator [Roseiarcus sp.]|nr:LysR family transcriptional regulator [Roseiarcus sp.]